jgi:rhamnosyltransferase
MKPCIVIRSHNDMPLIADTLAMVRRQDVPSELIVFDNDSTDGTLDEVKRYADRVYGVPRGAYVPGRVLNRGMEVSHGETVVFLNADCTPQGESWLRDLLAGFSDDRVAAVFGRQVPRPDCHPLYAKDTEETYGDGLRQGHWRHCFSMASSAVRRSVWEGMRFDERLRYSEDIDWTWRARGRGYVIRYVPDAVVAHSHNYTLRQTYRRQFGEGQAEAAIFEWSPWQRSLLRYSLLPCARRVASDWEYCLRRGEIRGALYSPVLRLAQLLGRRAGFRAGWKEGPNGDDLRPAGVR